MAECHKNGTAAACVTLTDGSVVQATVCASIGEDVGGTKVAEYEFFTLAGVKIDRTTIESWKHGNCDCPAVIAVEPKCHIGEGVEIDGLIWSQQGCGIGSAVKWVHPTDDIAIIDEQTIVGGWAYVINSEILPNCSVEAAGLLPGTPPDPTALPVVSVSTAIQEIKERQCDDSETYRYVIESGDGLLLPFIPVGPVGNCDDAEPECVKWTTLAVGLDNTRTRYNWNSTLELTNSDGSVLTFNQTATAGWTAQIQQWAAEIQALYPDCIAEPRCNIPGGCGGLLGPVSDAPLPSMVARYVHISCCPTGVYPVAARISSGTGAGRKLVVDFNTTPEKRGYRCLDCDSGYGLLHFEDGTLVPAADLPACVFGCEEALPATPDSEFELINGCDSGTDPIVSVVGLLDQTTGTIEYYTVDVDGQLEPYGLVGQFVDCETLEPAIDCPKEIVAVEPKVDYVSGSDTLGNSNGLVTWRIELFGAKYWSHPVVQIDGVDVVINGAQATYSNDVTNPGSVLEQAIRAAVGGSACPTAPMTFTVASRTVDGWLNYHAEGHTDCATPGTYDGEANAEHVIYEIANVPSNTVLNNIRVDTWDGIHDDGICPTYRVAFGEVSRVENPCVTLESCTEIQEIKERDCQGNLTYRYVTEDGFGNLIDYTPQGKVHASCPEIDCDACDPLVVADTVCNDADQTVDGVTISAGQPIIRKVVTYYRQIGCDCVETDQTTAFYDFNDPTAEFSTPPAFVGACNSETDTLQLCDRNGEPITVTTITVYTDDGGIQVQSYSDTNGTPVPEPLLPLGICNPDIELQEGCAILADGTRVHGNLHIAHNSAGRPDYATSWFFESETGDVRQLGADTWLPGCEETENCPLSLTKYCYDVSAFPYTCPSSTINVDDVTIDLCDAGPGVFVVDGDILATGGIRSENDPVRHPNASNNTGSGYDPSLITSDALNVAANPASIGGATHSGNQTVKVLFSGDLFGLSGTAPLITLQGTWVVGSGIGVGVYDPVQDLILPMGSGETPATYDVSNFGVEIYNGGTGSWGGVSGTHSWTVDTSGVADLSQLIIYTVVINPTGDELTDLVVNGEAPAPSGCDITSQADLIQVLTETTGTPWYIEDGQICTITDQVLGLISCGTTVAQPTITDATRDRDIPLVKIACPEDIACTSVQIVCYCVQSQGAIKTIKSEVKSISKALVSRKTVAEVKDSTVQPGKILEMCEERRYDCDGNYLLSTYLYQGKQLSQAQIDKMNLSVVPCSSPDVTYSPAAVTCATEDVDHDNDPSTADLQVVLNCQVFTNDTDPTDSFTQYSLAADYTAEGIGQIGDLYQPTSTLNVIACPPGSITETEECYRALVDVKGVAAAGDTITVTSITNAVAGTTVYTIVHSASQSVIYTGSDPLGDAGIDLGDVATWDGPGACDEPLPDESCECQIVEGCILSEGEHVPAYTIVDGTGSAMFAPIAKSTIGFVEDCCATPEGMIMARFGNEIVVGGDLTDATNIEALAKGSATILTSATVLAATFDDVRKSTRLTLSVEADASATYLRRATTSKKTETKSLSKQESV